MANRLLPVITSAAERPREELDDLVYGKLSWFTLFDRAITPTNNLAAGVAEIVKGAGGKVHRHEQDEIYYILEGHGVLTIEEVESPVGPGTAIFIPGNAWHTMRNDADAVLRLIYVFPAGGLKDVVYVNQDGS